MRVRVALAAASVVVVSACGSDRVPSTPSTTPSTASTSSSASAAASPTSAAAPVSPVATQAEGPCPYLDTTFIMQAVGQHISSTLVTTTTPPVGPLPQCDFFRSSGESVATVRTETTASPVAAKTAAIAVAPQGNPVTDVADGGVVLVGAGTTTVAVSKGVVVVVVVINQESSLQAREIAGQVVTAF